MTNVEQLIRATAGHRQVLDEIARHQADMEQIARAAIRTALARDPGPAALMRLAIPYRFAGEHCAAIER